jgi:hypothetical protein
MPTCRPCDVGSTRPGCGWRRCSTECGPGSERPHRIAAELEALPGIGPVIARRIVEGRRYRSVGELEGVKGIGKRRLEEIRPMVTAE